MITNQEFLQTLFGPDYIWAHVTSFRDDPSDIQNRARCWAGDYYSRTQLLPDSNQYFTISTFYADEENKARRRKALFRCAHVIVADDVREKLDIEQVKRLPVPTYKLQTSPGSEQWGWVLDHPCQDRGQVENLLDGLVANGLAPDGKDPGMKGVTRYVRLPEGVNTKASKLIDGVPQRCVMLEWSPEIKVSLQDLAAPFGVDLFAERRETRVDGAADVSDHPLLQVSEIQIKSVLSDGRFNITCPWVNEHTGAADDGAAVFTNNDGTIGFKCHHGACQERTGKNLLDFIEINNPGFKNQLETWKTLRVFKNIEIPVDNNQVDTKTSEPVVTGIAPQQVLIDQLKKLPPTEIQTITLAYEILKSVDSLDHGTRLKWWDAVRDHMGWSKPDLQTIVTQQRESWYQKKDDDDFYKEFVFVSSQNQFYNPKKRLWLTPEAFQNAHCHIDEAARSEALVGGKTAKVDRFDYSPGDPGIYKEHSVDFVNGWIGDIDKGTPGDVSLWFDHFDVLGWSDHRDHILKWMAFTLRHPEKKINHILLLGGPEGNGKDFLLYPLTRAMGRDAKSIEGDELLKNFSDYIVSTKYLHVNETELGDRQGASNIANKLKPFAANPPFTIRADIKGIRPVDVKNLFNVSMTTNSVLPVKLVSSRRFYGVWTNLSIMGPDRQVPEAWLKYFSYRWDWIMNRDGWRHCVDYLFNHVDLSDFDPGRVPMITEFIKDIQDSSEDPLTVVIRDLILEQKSFFASDLITSKDIYRVLKNAAMFDISYDFKTIPSPQTIGKVMRQANLGKNLRGWFGRNEIRVWAIRNFEKYENMAGSELFKSYENQINGVLKNEGLKAV